MLALYVVVVNILYQRFKGDDFLGTGISIGVDRLLFAIQQLDQIEINQENPVVEFVSWMKNIYPNIMKYFRFLRDDKINAEIFLDSKTNLGKQLTYANKRGNCLAVICSDNEI